MDFTPDRDIPDLSGKVIIITGGSSGLGKESAHQLAKHNPERIFLSARTAARGNAAIAEIENATPSIKGKITFLEMDLASFSSVQRAVKAFTVQANRLDILMNNAGGMAQTVGLTEDGYEVHFGSNYMGPALFTRLLLPVLQQTAALPGSDVRVVDVSSEAFRQAPPEGILLAKVKTDLSEIGSFARYGQSKLAGYYHTHNLAQQTENILFVALHPGAVNTGILDNLRKRRPYIGAVLGVLAGWVLTNVHQGARAQLWASTAPKKDIRNGAFYNPSLKEYNYPILTNVTLAQELEEWTNEEFRSKGL
jgi:NAD(P)-dependent dehydrogenase (short-subunit alcohol dehydrogenase family)